MRTLSSAPSTPSTNSGTERAPVAELAEASGSLAPSVEGGRRCLILSKIAASFVYFEEYDRINEAFYAEKQVQKWSRKKKEALINGEIKNLTALSELHAVSEDAFDPFDRLRGLPVVVN